MCSSLRYRQCMGRNYDYEISYKETLMNIPSTVGGNTIIGIGTGLIDYPLLYDGMNDKGLCCSALAFAGNACYDYKGTSYRKYKLPPYDFVRHVLANFNNVDEAKDYLEKTDIINLQYNERFPNSDLHWFVCDKDKSMVIEATTKGLNIYENPYDILTNNPPFPQQSSNCNSQNSLVGTYDEPIGIFNTRGTETYGLLGDTTSMSRFCRGSYLLKCMNGLDNIPFDDVASTFHLLSNLEQPYGATPVGDSYEYTIYSIVYDMMDLKVYVRTYGSIDVSCHSLDDKSWRREL